jgi:hypothetical protein
VSTWLQHCKKAQLKLEYSTRFSPISYFLKKRVLTRAFLSVPFTCVSNDEHHMRRNNLFATSVQPTVHMYEIVHKIYLKNRRFFAETTNDSVSEASPFSKAKKFCQCISLHYCKLTVVAVTREKRWNCLRGGGGLLKRHFLVSRIPENTWRNGVLNIFAYCLELDRLVSKILHV